uniref:RAP domain-containing protein n=1 Tax=Attheya septentrionalis TaxID=420275 RepID=A0A7S2UEC1_9STRA|mmetsp:Transcript_19017/g.34508  ORF Transcript_19017/g.34508 Transcript_19017/m.34508 type:complete len:215 (+) Transcript_19017:2-646(+)
MEANMEKLLKNGIAQGFCNICYALAISDFGKQHIKLLVEMWNRAVQMDVSNSSKEMLSQLAQVEAFMKADRIDLEEPPSELRLRMVSIVEKDNTVSRSHAQISGMLTKLGFIHENEVPPLEEWVMGSMLAIDMACPKQKIAIEFDGPSHYLKSVGTGDVTRLENGATKAKRRFLERVGWKVINLNYQDWIEVRHNKSEGILFLKKKLSDAGVKL